MKTHWVIPTDEDGKVLIDAAKIIKEIQSKMLAEQREKFEKCFCLPPGTLAKTDLSSPEGK